MSKKKVIVGLSGGVDSSVSALLLKEKGYDVYGVFMKIFDEKNNRSEKRSACYGPEEKDLEDVERVCKNLNIPLYIVDLKKEYNEIVLRYFVKEYLEGKTPNPCIICNRFIKFDILLKKVLSLGINFDFFATGHYALLEYDKIRKRYILKRGIDEEKDQTYFLFLLTQEQLSKIIFPLGNYTKKQVRELARKYNLHLSDKEESQDFICGDRSFFFRDREKEGFIVDKYGNILGRHKGIVYYTIGQRKGLGIAKGERLYVIGIDKEENKIIVGEEKDLYKKHLIAENLNYISIEKLVSEKEVEAKIRYKHTPAKCIIKPLDEKRVEVVFEREQRAPTPGQAVVFYEKDEVVGGGFIVKTF
ncbi:MAG: tRNA 2-thiouridine(34) synthase MnmA [Candidatus Omnitrophica bacterium]|nr:tRNA 2-thiouridine(34) synthase MnmA [Candidatus Omnitrophota bacterium]MCM8809574.1 tRNA 2-thiouridine(34) synthase MnmA [Candidatus Omnitrophota bacterium]MCM8810182.1 tRNA 2-thiouridine(34) synthase MnmA [Candidatus Omnitrophota bacterium]